MILKTQEVFDRTVVWVQTEDMTEIWEYPKEIEITEEFISSEWDRIKLERQEVQNGTTE